ncbi:MAG: hypothetical protein GY937_29035 [bacterium]|nr:hypothetical protein [bacterium]
MPEIELERELAFFEYGPEDRALLGGLKPVLEQHAERLVAAFYRHLLSFPETQQFLRDPEVTKRLLREQRRYLLSLAGPEVDAAYVLDRRRIGEMHERIGLGPRWYVGAYSLYFGLLTPLICEHSAGDPLKSERLLVALQKLMNFDMQIAMERYMARRERDLKHLNDELAAAGRQLARDLESTGIELRQTAERARAAERLASIGVLVAGLAHEIGTPMGVIRGHAKLLEPAVQGDDAKWRLQTIQQQIGRISRIIESLLGMARPQRSRRLPVELRPLIENTVAFLREKFSRRGIEPRLELAELGSVAGDPERLQQVLLNLFLNAADAMPEGGDLVVKLSQCAEGEAEIQVSDTGPGIALEDPDEVFDPFVTTKEAGEGNGLGLSVAHGIVAEHGGMIEVASSDRDGTVFRIMLPLIQ